MQTISLDLSFKANIEKEMLTLTAKQGDVGRKFQVVLTDDGTAYDVPADAIVSVWYRGTSGTGNYTSIAGNNAITVDGNVITVEMIQQMLMNKGAGELCLIIHAADGSQIGLWDIPYHVEGIPGKDSEVATAYFSDITGILNQTAEYARQAMAAAEAFVPDVTLSISGRAADALVTGEAIGKLVMKEELKSLSYSQTDCDGSISNETLTNYPSAPGVYCVGAPIKGIPFGASGYGCLVVFNGGSYVMHLYQDLEGYMFCGRTDTMPVTAPNNWSCLPKIHEAYPGSYTVKINGVIKWINPPMNTDEEYATLEQFEGKTVYTKLLNMGSLPSQAGSIQVDIGNSSGTLFKYHATAYNSGSGARIPIPYITTGSTTQIASIAAIGTNLSISVNSGNFSGYKVTAQIWYVKD